MVDFPTPSGYRQSTVPPVFPTTEDSPVAKRFERKRLYFWFGVAVLLHVALLLAFFLSPKLRLKASYSPDRWVQILSIPAEPPQAQDAAAVEKAPAEEKKKSGAATPPAPKASKHSAVAHPTHQPKPALETSGAQRPPPDASP